VQGRAVRRLVVAALLAALWPAAGARAGMLTVSSCVYYHDAGYGWSAYSTGSHWELANDCAASPAVGFRIGSSGAPQDINTTAHWIITAPAGVEIVHAYTPPGSVLVDGSLRGDGYTAEYSWAGGGKAIDRGAADDQSGGMDYGSTINQSIGPSSYFALVANCTIRQCQLTNNATAVLQVYGVQLVAVDNTPPSLDALGANLYYQHGWVRGPDWPASFQASDAVGVCDMTETVGTSVVQGPQSAPNTGSFVQCPTQQTQQLTVDTTAYPDGVLPLTLYARDAAGNVAQAVSQVHIDNEPVVLSLSAPAQAQGPVDVQASAQAGPSGVAAIHCTVDGQQRIYPGASAQIPVSGPGEHQISCYAANNALDVAGQPAVSATQTATVDIQQPVALSLSFHRLAGLRCRRVRVRCREHGRVVRSRARVCRERFRRRRVLVVVRRHGHKRRVVVVRRVPIPPRLETLRRLRARHGQAVTVYGLASAAGAPLAGQPVQILAAPAIPGARYQLVGTATTGPDGQFAFRLPPGPSRLIEASYAATATTAAAASAPIRLLVPARVRIRVGPRRARWGGVIRISGRLLGGYVPAGSKLIRLNVGIGHVGRIVGLPDITRAGRFHIRFRLFPGRGRLRLWFSVSTLPEASYPWAPATSRRVTVTIGQGAPRAARHEHHYHHHRRGHHRHRRGHHHHH